MMIARSYVLAIFSRGIRPGAIRMENAVPGGVDAVDERDPFVQPEWGGRGSGGYGDLGEVPEDHPPPPPLDQPEPSPMQDLVLGGVLLLRLRLGYKKILGLPRPWR